MKSPLTINAGPQGTGSVEDRRLSAYRALGLRVEDVRAAPQITPQLRAISAVLRREDQPRVTTRVFGDGDDLPVTETTTHTPPRGPGADVARSWPWYLETCEDPSARKVLESYYSTLKSYRSVLPIEAFCVAAGVSPFRILELLTGALVRVGATASTIVAAVNHPRVVQKTVDMALTDDGHDDRSDLHKAVGFLPTAKGSQTTIQVVQNASAAAPAHATPPSPEATIRKLVGRFNNDSRTPLPALPVQTELIEEANVVEEEEE